MVRSGAIQTVSERANLYLDQALAVNLTGPPGVGKTTLALDLAEGRRRSVVFVQGNSATVVEDLVGGYRGYRHHKVVDNFVREVLKLDEQVETRWESGWLTKAVANGQVVVFDEFNRVTAEVQTVLLAVLQEKVLPITRLGHGENIDVHPEFRLILTTAVYGQAGVHPIPDPLGDRLVTIVLDPLDETTEAKIVCAHSGLEVEEGKQIVRLTRHLKSPGAKAGSAKQNLRPTSSVRAGIALARICRTQGWSLREQIWPPVLPAVIHDLCGPSCGYSLIEIENYLRLAAKESSR